MVVVQRHITRQRLLQIFTAAEPVDLEYISNAAIESLDHVIGSRGPGLGQPVLDPQLLAQRVGLMVFAGLAFAAGRQPVRKLLAGVGHQFDDPDRAGLVQGLEKSAGRQRSCLP